MKYTKEIVIAGTIAVVTIVVFFVLGYFGIPGIMTTSAPLPSSGEEFDAQTLLNEISTTGTVADLRVITTTSGEGDTVERGDTVTVHYIGVLPDGTVFDSSLPRGTPFSFVVGAGQVIEGWDTGLAGARVGDRLLLAIPPELAYGDRSVGTIPPGSTLIFEVEVLGVEKPSAGTSGGE